MNNKAIKALLEANRLMLFDGRQITVSIAVAFLGVALWEDYVDRDGEPMTLADLAAKLGMSPTTLSQHSRYLGEWYRDDKPGLGLIETDTYVENRRRKTFSLTPEGRRVAEMLVAIVQKAGRDG